MRNHMIVPDVGLRDSAYFSVIDEEWPEVRANLRRRLARGAVDWLARQQGLGWPDGRTGRVGSAEEEIGCTTT